jgi:hypothetical protein
LILRSLMTSPASTVARVQAWHSLLSDLGAAPIYEDIDPPGPSFGTPGIDIAINHLAVTYHGPQTLQTPWESNLGHTVQPRSDLPTFEKKTPGVCSILVMMFDTYSLEHVKCQLQSSM